MILTLRSAAYIILGLLSALSIIIVKFAVSQNHNKKIKKKQNSRNIYSCKQVFMFLIKRFTFLEIYIVRTSRLKLTLNLSFALHLLINFLFENGYFWSWIATVVICVGIFLITEIYIQKTKTTVQQQNSMQQTQQLYLRKILIYGIYSLISILIYVAFCFLFYYSNINITFLYQTFLPALIIDQFLGRPIFFIFISFLSNQSHSLIFLMETYNELQKISEQAKKLQNNSAVFPASPQHKNKQLKRLSPSKIPKAINRLEIQDNFSIEPKPALNNTTIEADSLINILQQNHKKKTQQSKLNLSGSFNEGMTPKKKIIKSHHKSLQNSLEFVNNNNIMIKSPIFQENKYKSPSAQKKNIRIITGIQNQQPEYPLQNLSQIKPIQQFHENSKNRCSVNRDLNISREYIESAKKSHKFEFTLKDKQIQEMNTFEIQSKQSPKSVNKKQLSDNQSPKSIKGRFQNQINDQSNRKKCRQESSYKKNSINYIEQQPQHEQQYPQNKQFQLNSLNGSHFPLMNNISQQYIVENEKIYKICNENSQTQQNKHTLLEIKQQNQNEIQQLSEFDMNSPIKKTYEHQQNTLGKIKLKSQLNTNLPLRYKKRPLHKRDLKQLKKLNSNSPYLEYLPNMLTKQIQKHQKQGEQKQKRERSTRRQSNHPTKQINNQIRAKQDTQLNNQNICPKIQQDF